MNLFSGGPDDSAAAFRVGFGWRPSLDNATRPRNLPLRGRAQGVHLVMRAAGKLQLARKKELFCMQKSNKISK